MDYWLRFLLIMTVISSLFSTETYARRDDPVVQYRPQKYKRPTFGMSLAPVDQSQGTADLWVVYVDRVGVYTDRGIPLTFKKRYYVTGERSESVYVVEYEPGKISRNGNGYTIRNPKELGWISKNEVLLWEQAICDERSKFRLKGMLVFTPVAFKRDLAFDEVRFYDSPTSQTPNNNVAPIFQILYIFKRLGARYLLAERSYLGNNPAEDYILGWADTSQVVRWNQRQTLEPNQTDSAIRERRASGTPTRGFTELAPAIDYYEREQLTDQALWEDDPYDNKLSTYFKRMPIFSVKRTETKDGYTVPSIVESGIVSGIFNLEGGKLISKDAMLELEEKVSKGTIRARNINVLFVVDATRSMEDYFPAIRGGITQAVKELKDSENKFRFGAIAYRDYADSRGLKEMMGTNLVSDNNKVEAFFDNLQVGQNPTESEAVNTGLKEGIKQFFSTGVNMDSQTNVVILIGDAGDRKGSGRVSLAEVEALLIRYQCSFMALQAHRRLSRPYDDFIYDISRLIVKAAKGMAKEWRETYPKTSTNDFLTPEWKQLEGNLYSLIPETAIPIGKIQFARKQDSLTPKQTRALIIDMFREMDSTNNRRIAQIEDVLLQSNVTEEPSFTPKAWQVLRNAGLTDDDIALLKLRKAQLMFRAYIPIRVKGQTHDLFSYSVLVDQDELDQLITQLTLMTNFMGTGSARREEMQATWLTVLQTNLGIAESAGLENERLSYLIGRVTGLPSQSKLLRDHTFGQIIQRDQLPDAALESIVDHLLEQVNKLRRVNGNKQHYFYSVGRRYYWIPMDVLP